MRILETDQAKAILSCAVRCESCTILHELGYTHKCGESGVWFEECFCSAFIAMKLEQVKRDLQPAETAVDIVFDPTVEAEINNQIILGALHEYEISLTRVRDEQESGSVRDFIERKLQRCRRLIEAYEGTKRS